MSAVPSRKASDWRTASSSSITWTMALSDGIAQILRAYAPQREAKDGPAGRIALRTDLSAVGLYNGAGDRQAHAHAVALGGDEGLKQLRRHFRCYPAAGVRHADGDHVVVSLGRKYDELSFFRVLHCLDGIAQQIEQDLLDLHLIGQHKIDCRVELKSHADALILGAYERERARLLDELLDAFDPTLALAARHEIAQAADDLSGAQRLISGLVHGIAEQCGLIIGAIREQSSRALHVVRNRRQWLVELMRQRRRHLAHGRQSGDVDKLGLQLLQPRFGLLPLGQVADEAGEEALIARPHLSDGKLHRKSRAVPALADDQSADSDDSPFSGAQISLEIPIVILPVWRRHQELDVFSKHSRRGESEQPLGRRTERLDDSVLVDDDHRIRHGIQDRLQMGLPPESIPRARGSDRMVALQLLDAPSNP